MGSTWLALSDKDQEGDWVWTNKMLTPTTGYTNWLHGEPNDSNGAEDCAELIVGDKHGHSEWNGRWNDVPCHGYKGTFVCQRKKVNGELVSEM